MKKAIAPGSPRQIKLTVRSELTGLRTDIVADHLCTTRSHEVFRSELILTGFSTILLMYFMKKNARVIASRNPPGGEFSIRRYIRANILGLPIHEYTCPRKLAEKKATFRRYVLWNSGASCPDPCNVN